MLDILFLNNIKKNFFFNTPFFKNFLVRGVLHIKHGNFYNFFIFYFLFNFLFGVFPLSYKINMRGFDLDYSNSDFFKIIFFCTFNRNYFYLPIGKNFAFVLLSNLEKENVYWNFPVDYRLRINKNSLYAGFLNIWDIFYLLGNTSNYFISKNIILDFCLILNKKSLINIVETP